MNVPGREQNTNRCLDCQVNREPAVICGQLVLGFVLQKQIGERRVPDFNRQVKRRVAFYVCTINVGTV